MTKIPDTLKMLKAGLHFGHRSSKWHPKMKPYIFTTRNDIHIIDLEKTRKALKNACEFIEDLSAKDGVILFLGSKPQIKELVRKKAIEANSPSVVDRWLGGTITNFFIISQVINKYNNLKKEKEDGGWDEKYTKKEQVVLRKEVERLEKKVGGIKNLKKIPDAIFIIDCKNEKTALNEAKLKKVPVIALCDTNINPDGIDYVIPGNDDSIKGIEMILGLVVEAIKNGRNKPINQKNNK
ncbi:MAG: 30S ribosomal protein S2 [Patescibacteria group bacterium]|nr:30S ribosomal protein S2 [Patescibacteria group bacterium]